jgi:hypothetical protein
MATNKYTERWACHCPECGSTLKEFMAETEYPDRIDRDYECECGMLYAVEYPKKQEAVNE